MTEYEIIILGFALALDALIVSICYGIVICEHRLFNSLKFAIAFGFFQGIMPVLGWHLTSIVYEQLKNYSKWLVFIIFIILGFKFLKSAFSKEKEKNKINCISFSCLIMLAVLTSIDAFGAGVSLKLLDTPIIRASLEIGVITFILSFLGFWFSQIFKKFSSKTVEIVGAVLLIYLAVKAVI